MLKKHYYTHNEAIRAQEENEVRRIIEELERKLAEKRRVTRTGVATLLSSSFILPPHALQTHPEMNCHEAMRAALGRDILRILSDCSDVPATTANTEQNRRPQCDRSLRAQRQVDLEQELTQLNVQVEALRVKNLSLAAALAESFH